MCPRAGQDFAVVNIDKREIASLPRGELYDLLFGREADRIFFHLLRLTVTFKSSDGDDATEADVRAGCFPKFPAEIVSDIFDEIDDIRDCFCLALTSKRCWLLGQSRMKSLILDQAIQWAGDRIICVGDYLRCGDLPENLLSAEETAILDQYHDEYPNGYMYDHLMTYCNIGAPKTAYQPYTLIHTLARKHLPWQYQNTLSKYISIGYRQPDILRNISKRQYVRRKALWGMIKICPKHWRWDQVDLGHVILSRICWSSRGDFSTWYLGDISSGVWAGDRFDITSSEALEEKDENGQSVAWTDVTEEVLREMFKIWLRRYGGERD